MRPHDVELSIDELVLQGFAPADRRLVGDAIERALARILAAEGLPGGASRTAAAERLDGGVASIDPRGEPEAIGEGIARAIHGSLKGLAR